MQNYLNPIFIKKLEKSFLYTAIIFLISSLTLFIIHFSQTLEAKKLFYIFEFVIFFSSLLSIYFGFKTFLGKLNIFFSISLLFILLFIINENYKKGLENYLILFYSLILSIPWLLCFSFNLIIFYLLIIVNFIIYFFIFDSFGLNILFFKYNLNILTIFYLTNFIFFIFVFILYHFKKINKFILILNFVFLIIPLIFSTYLDIDTFLTNNSKLNFDFIFLFFILFFIITINFIKKKIDFKKNFGLKTFEKKSFEQKSLKEKNLKLNTFKQNTFKQKTIVNENANYTLEKLIAFLKNSHVTIIILFFLLGLLLKYFLNNFFKLELLTNSNIFFLSSENIGLILNIIFVFFTIILLNFYKNNKIKTTSELNFIKFSCIIFFIYSQIEFFSFINLDLAEFKFIYYIFLILYIILITYFFILSDNFYFYFFIFLFFIINISEIFSKILNLNLYYKINFIYTILLFLFLIQNLLEIKEIKLSNKIQQTYRQIWSNKTIFEALNKVITILIFIIITLKLFNFFEQKNLLFETFLSLIGTIVFLTFNYNLITPKIKNFIKKNFLIIFLLAILLILLNIFSHILIGFFLYFLGIKLYSNFFKIVGVIIIINSFLIFFVNLGVTIILIAYILFFSSIVILLIRNLLLINSKMVINKK